MAFKIYKSENYFIINDTSTGEDVLRQVRDNVRWEKKDSKYSFFLKSNLLLKNEDQFVKSSKDLKQLPFSNIYGPIDFTDTVDSTGTAWASESVLDTFLNKWTGYIHLETIGADASYNVINSASTVLASGTIASGASADITAPDGIINIKKTGDGTISSQSVPSGATVDYNVADNAITVNSANGFSIDATDPLDIVLKDTTGATVTPTSVTPHAGTHHVDIVLPAPATPTSASAKVMQTGQTSTYSSDEIGYVTKGRLIDFFTVNFITPFGNSNRFTSTNHAAQTTYTNEIVLDWSTFDEPTQTVLGYDRRLVHSGATYDFTHSAGITLAKNHSRGTYTSGWRMWNRHEFNNIVNLEYSNGFAPPFDNASGGQIETQNMWLINTLKISTSQAWFTAYYGNIDYGAKSGNRRVVAVRDFTVSGTTIL